MKIAVLNGSPKVGNTAAMINAAENLPHFLLLSNSSYSELLLKSEADYRFFTELKRRTDEAVIEQSDEATAFEFGTAKVLFDKSRICVFVGDKQVDMCTVQEFSKHPNATFRRLQKYAELVIRS